MASEPLVPTWPVSGVPRSPEEHMSNVWYVVGLVAYPIYVLLMAGVLRLCGVRKHEVARWTLRQAGRPRFRDLIAAARGLPSGDGAERSVPQSSRDLTSGQSLGEDDDE